MRILIADHHQLFREALASYIKRARIADLVSAAHDLIAARDHLARREPYDIVLVAENLPGLNDVADIGDMMRVSLTAKFVLLAEDQGRLDRAALVKSGLCGYFPKSMSGHDMIGALQDIAHGQVYLAALNRTAVMPRFFEPATSFLPRPPGLAALQLTNREYDVLACLVRGQSNAEIATRLGIQLVTVKLHMRNLTRKLGARNRTEAALLAREQGLISVRD